jgi:hypothetical protein
VLAARPPAPSPVPPAADRSTELLRLLPAGAVAAAAGLLAAAVVAGPGPSDLAVRVGASVVGVGVAFAFGVAARRPPLGRVAPWIALAAGAVAVVLAGWPS